MIILIQKLILTQLVTPISSYVTNNDLYADVSRFTNTFSIHRY